MAAPAYTAVTRSPEETRELAAELAPELGPKRALLLDGDLGAGKTTLVAGLLAAIGGEGPVTSPTFTLENRYPTPSTTAISQVIHVDLYRLDGELEPRLLESVMEAREEGALVVVEWPGPLRPYLQPYLEATISMVPIEGSEAFARRFELRAVGDAWPGFESSRRWERRGAP